MPAQRSRHTEVGHPRPSELKVEASSGGRMLKMQSVAQTGPIVTSVTPDSPPSSPAKRGPTGAGSPPRFGTSSASQSGVQMGRRGTEMSWQATSTSTLAQARMHRLTSRV